MKHNLAECTIPLIFHARVACGLGLKASKMQIDDHLERSRSIKPAELKGITEPRGFYQWPELA